MPESSVRLPFPGAIKNAKKRRMPALLEIWIAFAKFRVGEEELNCDDLLVAHLNQSTHALAQGKLEHARLFNFLKGERAQLLFNSAPIVRHQRIRNAQCSGNFQLRRVIGA